jgi:hypothetical protein
VGIARACGVNLEAGTDFLAALQVHKRIPTSCSWNRIIAWRLNGLPNDPSFGGWGLDNTGQDGGTFDADIDARPGT